MRIYTAGVIKIGEQFLMVYNEAIGAWVFPGGKPEGDETAYACMVREVNEETGVTIYGATYLSTHFTLVKGVEWCGIIYNINNWVGMPHVVEPEKCSGIQFFKASEITTEPERSIVLTMLQTEEVAKVETGWLIESQREGHATWFAGQGVLFTDNPNVPIRFARKQDAEQYIFTSSLRTCADLTVNEHQWG